MNHPDPSVGPEELAAHLEVCATCAGRVRIARSTPVPAWAREWEARRAGHLPFWKSTVARFVAAALLGLAASLAVMAPAVLPVLARGRLWASPLFSRARDAPVVELWRQRDRERTRWDFGRCLAGDAPALRVQPSVFRHLLVARTDAGRWKALLAQPIQPGRPENLVVDLPAPLSGPYALAVLFSDEVIGTDALVQLEAKKEHWLAGRGEGRPYVVQLWVSCGD